MVWVRSPSPRMCLNGLRYTGCQQRAFFGAERILRVSKHITCYHLTHALSHVASTASPACVARRLKEGTVVSTDDPVPTPRVPPSLREGAAVVFANRTSPSCDSGQELDVVLCEDRPRAPGPTPARSACWPRSLLCRTDCVRLSLPPGLFFSTIRSASSHHTAWVVSNSRHKISRLLLATFRRQSPHGSSLIYVF